MTTTKLVRLEDVIDIIKKCEGIKSGNHITRITGSIEDNILALPTYPEPIKGSNHSLLQEYIDKLNTTDMVDAYSILIEVQFRLTEGTEYIIGKEYEFSDDGKSWIIGPLEGFSTDAISVWPYIRPIPVSPELTSAMAVLEANGYIVCKK